MNEPRNTYQPLRDKDAILAWLEKNDRNFVNNSYTIRDDFIVDSASYINLNFMNLTEIAVQFGVVTGDFSCTDNHLKTLHGCPQTVRGSFGCNHNEIESLEAGPTVVMGNYHCENNLLRNLKGLPETLFHGLCCDNNQLESLQGVPEKIPQSFTFSHNYIETLEYAPKKVGGTFDCSYNLLRTLDNSPETGSSYLCHHNELLTLEGIKSQVYFQFDCSHNALTHLTYGPEVDREASYDCSYNKIRDLTGLPDCVEKLTISYNQLESLKGCSSDVTIFESYGNHLTDLEHFPRVRGDFYYGDCRMLSLQTLIQANLKIEKNIFHEVGKEEEIYPELAEFYNRDFGHTFVCFPWSDIPSILLHSHLQEGMKEKNKVKARPKI